MKNKFALLIITLTSLAYTSLAFAAEVKIAAVVNERIVTASDVEDRMKLYLLGSKGQPPKEVIDKLTQQTLDELINESLQKQEADKFGLQIPEEQIDGGIAEIAKRNNTTADVMLKQFAAAGVNIKSLRDKVRSEFSWPILVKRKWQSQISISDDEIDMTIDKLNNRSEPEYLIAEILLIVPEKSKDQEVHAQALELLKRIKEGTPFSSIALKFSQSPGAATGGDMGWMQESHLTQRVRDAVTKMKPGEISNPIRSEKGWHIILLREAKKSEEITKDELNKKDEKSRDMIASQIGNKRLNQMAQHYLNDLRSSAFIEKRM